MQALVWWQLEHALLMHHPGTTLHPEGLLCGGCGRRRHVQRAIHSHGDGRGQLRERAALELGC